MGKGKQIGTVEISREVRGKVVTYRSVNESSVSFIKRIEVHHELEATYREGVLTRSRVEVRVNGKVHNQTAIDYDGQKYSVNPIKEAPHYVLEPILFSSIRLYFEEPEGIGRVFSEQFGTFHSIAPAGPDRFVLQKEEGKPNHYTYANGVAVHIELGTGLMQTEMVLVEKTQ